MKDRVITAHVPEALAREVSSLAEQIDRSRGWIVKEALQRYVDLERRRHQLTLDALAEVDSGQTGENEVIERWAEGLGRRRRAPRR
jgi:predicted transcriptional regulator